MHLVHVGAHRTGTTSLQHFLDANRNIFRELSVNVLAPPETREHSQITHPKTGDTIFSEENLIGTMEHNLWNTSLYPNAKEFLERNEHNFEGATTILLSIRDIADWWRSAILFLVEKNLPLPTEEVLAGIADSERGWINVVQDLKDTFPDVRLIVREFQWKPDNPKQLLRIATDNEELNKCRLDRRSRNSAPAYNKLIVSLFCRNDFDSLRQVKRDPSLALFSKEQFEKMDRLYAEDLKKIQQLDTVEFLFDESAQRAARKGRSYLNPVEQPDQNAIEGPKCMLHIGKTGSDLIRAAFGAENIARAGTVLCGPDETLATTLEKFGPNRKLVFFFRDPIKRFVDGFLSRMRQGRPMYQSSWSDGEAIAFTYFATPNDLAEALFGDDERMDSAARYALDQLFHSKLDQEFFLTSPQAVEFEFSSGNIRFCCDFDHMERHLAKLGAELSVDIENVEWSNPEKPHYELSYESLKNLKRVLKKEIEVYKSCKRVAAELGFDG